jgi:uncharacterized membrane protein
VPIGFAVLRPELLLLILLVPALLLAWWAWPPPLERRRSRLAMGLRVLLIALLVFALAGVRITTQPTKRAIVAVVDLSASDRGSVDAEAAAVRSLAATKGPDDLFGVVTFGHDAAVEMPLTRSPSFDIFQTQPDPSYTDIAGALRLAAGLVPEGYARQLVLVSDGRQNLGDAAAAVAALRAEGVRVDVLPAGTAPAAEALVTAVDAPAQLREGQTFTVTTHLRSSVEAAGRLTVLVDGREAGSRDITLPAGSSTQSFDLPTMGVGLHRVRVELIAQPDTYTQNNVGEAAVKVLGRPRVLILEGLAGEGANVEKALLAAGMAVDRRPAVAAPTDTSTLGTYDSTVVVDAAADAFPRLSLNAIAAATHDLGHGLVTIGGPTSYGPGGWQGTPLDDALPVRMDLPNRKDKPKVAVVLVMETMEDARADQVSIGAAEAVIDQLTPQDQVAVTNGQAGFIVPLTTVGDKKAIDTKLEAASLGDPPSYLPFVQLGGDALLKTDAPLKHIVVLGDGDAEFAQGGDLKSTLQALLQKGVTTSAIGVDVHGSGTFMSNMQDIATWGGGRFYQSNNPSQVPQLLLKESVTSLRPWFEQTPFFPKVTAAGDLLQGVPLDSFPQLGGYVVTTAKPASEIYFNSDKQDPVLAAWSYGLGRSVAWTSDSNGAWTAGFLRSPLSATLFARMVAWSLPTGANSLQVEAVPSGDGLQLTVTGPTTNGGTLQVGVVQPDLSNSSQDLVAVAPGRWQGRVSATTVGTYLLHAALLKNGAPVAQTDTAIAVPYSPEYLELGRDDGLLRQVAKEGAGVLLARAELAWAQQPLPVPISTDIFWVLLVLVALLWPLDVAMRRITLGPRQLLAAAAALSRRRPAQIEIAAPEELVRLRRRVAATRRPRPDAPATPVVASQEAPPPAAEPVSEQEAEEALSARLLEARRRRRGHGD